MSSTVLIPLAPGFEEMEAIILTDVLRRGGVNVITASLHEGPITASRKTVHLADQTLESVVTQDFDLILLPGGLEGTKNLQNSEPLKKMVLQHKERGMSIGAICAAPNALRTWGLILGTDPFTAFPSSVSLSNGGTYVSDRIVSHNNVFTSVGPGSAFEFALYLLEKLEGLEIRQKVEEGLYLPK